MVVSTLPMIPKCTINELVQGANAVSRDRVATVEIADDLELRCINLSTPLEKNLLFLSAPYDASGHMVEIQASMRGELLAIRAIQEEVLESGPRRQIDDVVYANEILLIHVPEVEPAHDLLLSLLTTVLDGHLVPAVCSCHGKRAVQVGRPFPTAFVD